MCWARVHERDEHDVADSEGWEVVKPDRSGRGVSAVVRDRVDGDGRDMANGGGCEVKGGGQGVNGDGCDVANGVLGDEAKGRRVVKSDGGGWGVNGDGRDMASVEGRRARRRWGDAHSAGPVGGKTLELISGGTSHNATPWAMCNNVGRNIQWGWRCGDWGVQCMAEPEGGETHCIMLWRGGRR
ncbi:hypothetical protein BD779DRAFT_1479152 [Infundibulicybe gibba]|nr:hypothetical protein BD779DRAFT_1479152 [Infundibulicybe gibba]